MLSAKLTNAQRKAIYRRDGYRCALCDSTKYIQIHHIIPRGSGGTDHPHNPTFGGSIKVVPIRPNEDDLKKIAEKHDRPGVPHLLHSSSLGTYLCTRRTEDVKDGVSQANTAVSAAAWAADWALHFEIGIRDKKIWNKWCDDEHFRRLKI